MIELWDSRRAGGLEDTVVSLFGEYDLSEESHKDLKDVMASRVCLARFIFW